MDILKEKSNQLFIGLTSKKEKIITDAVSAQIGNDYWLMTDLAGRCSIKILPDKTEIFSLDDVDLIHFGHVKTEIQNSGMGIRFKATQEYKVLV